MYNGMMEQPADGLRLPNVVITPIWVSSHVKSSVPALMHILVVGKYAPAEGHHAPRYCMHGKYHTAGISVLKLSVLLAVASSFVTLERISPVVLLS